MRPCSVCAARESTTVVRDNFITPVDPTLGLVEGADSTWTCPDCGQAYTRQVEEATRFHDYDEYWFSKVAPAGFGCVRCHGDDPELAWTASQAQRRHALVQDSHFGIHLTACACGQVFATVFTERIDWVGGEDPQLWLVLPLTVAEAAELSRTDETALVATLTRFGHDRRFLVRDFPSDGTISLWWRASGFAVGPHD